ncbi:hypothetical protein QBC36DRAFT_353657 [Triangularia setosa]|uniref:Aminoglycoside phosphotransferase domain-containing protein n=1 Tax=Triangularia setosa TaxID=2587417 RepID=A0AAN6W7L0_9PEZI|nr:hypothetical protein QBC36DRAFT_353657 [Podospora setosa]
MAKRRYLEMLLVGIIAKALEAVASNSQQGTLCKIAALDGSAPPINNCHVDIEFQYSVVWLTRIRLDDPQLPPRPVQDYIFLSEVAKLQFLEDTKVLAPHIYAYALKSTPEYQVGTSFILMEKRAGKPLDWSQTTMEQRTRAMDQLADIFLELEKYPFSRTGFLILSSGLSLQVNVGGFAQVACFKTPRQTLCSFDTLEAAYSAIIDRQIWLLATNEVSSLRLENYLSFLWRLQGLPELIAKSASRTSPFHLKHFDGEKGDHILVDGNHNIATIIDWCDKGWSSIYFNNFQWPVCDFHRGSNRLTKEELRFDLANIVRGSHQWQRYLLSLGADFPRDMSEFEPLVEGLRETFSK